MSLPVSARPAHSKPHLPSPGEAAKPAPCKAFSLAAPDATTAASAPAAGPARAAPLPAGPLSSPATESAKRVLTRMLDDEAKVDRGLHAAMSGRPMSAPELLVLQAQVIQYSQEVEIASRVVDKATGAVKQVLQTQV
jgi:hypothetical protein